MSCKILQDNAFFLQTPFRNLLRIFSPERFLQEFSFHERFLQESSAFFQKSSRKVKEGLSKIFILWTLDILKGAHFSFYRSLTFNQLYKMTSNTQQLLLAPCRNYLQRPENLVASNCFKNNGIPETKITNSISEGKNLKKN